MLPYPLLSVSPEATFTKLQEASTRLLMMPFTIPLFRLILTSFLLPLSYSCTFTITNDCPYTIWPGTLAGAGNPQLASTGFRLDSGQSVSLSSVPGWSGRIWARTGCTFDGSGNGSCQTGDCGGRLECVGNGATPPASLFEITLGTGNVKDYYDVSLVDGYNLPLVAAPVGIHGACNVTGCVSDVNMGKVFHLPTNFRLTFWALRLDNDLIASTFRIYNFK
jgi:hypothetical protein